MAIARGAGTEIIRCHHFEDVAQTVQHLITGEQHHIYTVLSIIFQCEARSGTEKGMLRFYGYDAMAGTSNQTHKICTTRVAADDTFVWNDKFSFNGFEPVDFTGPLSEVAHANAIADQGGSVAQYLTFQTDSSNTKYDVHITFIDQNNA